MKIGINGFGRIGKSLFLQLLFDTSFDIEICAINAIHLTINKIENYLKYDSTHNYDKNFTINIDNEDKSYFNIVYKNKSHKVKLFSERDISKINWNVDFLFEASGAFLNTNDCLKHNVKNVLITAPVKDNTPTFIFDVNHTNYNSQSIFSCASCTTTSISPFLKYIDTHYTINNASFTTIHSSTSSQYILDTPNIHSKSGRSSRSIFNNLIPATTGASSAIKAVLPQLDGKIHGMAIRVPTNNVSLIDLVIECDKYCNINEICENIKRLNSKIMRIEEAELVSCDFQTTTFSTIIDKPSMIQLDKNKFKVLIWYDNEWSYSTQCINMSKYIYEKNFLNNNNNIKYNFINDYVSFKNKNVLIRVDYNVPFDKNGNISDNFRIVSTLNSINRILKDMPKRVIIATHLGRPNLKKSMKENEKYSTKHLLNEISKLLNKEVRFLENGVSYKTLNEIKDIENQDYLYSLYEIDEHVSPRLFNNNNKYPKIYLLENLRFHNDETDFENNYFNKENSEMYKVWNKLGNVFVNCAFGCSHRNHLSMYGYEYNSGFIYYDYLMESEIKALEELTINRENKRILTILGGAKIDDKLPLCNALLPKINNLFLGGGIINSYIYNQNHKEFIETLDLNKKTFLMNDGYGNSSLNEISKKNLNGYNIENNYYYDIGSSSIVQLYNLIHKNDIIFWNGTLGVVENELYNNGSKSLLNYLLKSGKRVIIGGGDSASFVNNYIKKSNEKYNLDNLHICTGGGASIDFIIKGKLGFD